MARPKTRPQLAGTQTKRPASDQNSPSSSNHGTKKRSATTTRATSRTATPLPQELNHTQPTTLQASVHAERDISAESIEADNGSDEEDHEEAILGGGNSDDGSGESVDNDTADDDEGHESMENDNAGEDEGGRNSFRPRNRDDSAFDDPDSITYIEDMTSSSGLHIAEQTRVVKSYQNKGEMGLFSLFITKEFKNRIMGWTNKGLKLRGNEETTESELDAYIGLELAMSICPLNDIAEFWSGKRFTGQPDFASTMSRSRFQAIRGRIKFHPPDMTSGDGKDPLWHSRILMEHVQTKFAQVAIPYGTSSLDENSVRTKARTRAKSYIPSKPDKYAIRFYAVVAWKSLYVHSIWDNGSGNFTRTTPAGRYTRVFPSLSTPLGRTLDNPDITVGKKSASALWVAMMGHQSLLAQSPTGRRLMITDNFYTRHALAKTLLEFSDRETRMLGTMRENNVDKFSKDTVAASIARVEAAPRGTWELIAIVEQEAGYTKRKADHAKAQRNTPKQQRRPFPQPVKVFAPNSGYIVFKDKKMVLFYTNDLRRTPTKIVLKQDDPEAIDCVHGLFPIKRWTGEENLHRKIFMVPTLIAAYNIGMNGVDRVDQLRSTNPTRRKEMRLSMSIFTWALDLCVINAFALYRAINSADAPTVSLREFKRRIAEQLTAKQLANMELRRSKKRKQQESTVNGIVGGITSRHILTPNSTAASDGQLKCLLCRIRGFQKRSRWGCAECQVGFHVECFAAYHFRDVFRSASTPSVRHALELVCASATGNSAFRTRTKKNNSITSVSMLQLPSPPPCQRIGTTDSLQSRTNSS